MPNTVDTLAVQINASARSTYNSIQKLSGQLKDLSNVLQNIDTTRLDSLNANQSIKLKYIALIPLS